MTGQVPIIVIIVIRNNSWREWREVFPIIRTVINDSKNAVVSVSFRGIW